MDRTNPAGEVSYNRRAFAEAYVLARASEDDAFGEYQQEQSAYNTALRAHRQRVLDGLQTLFQLRLDRESISSTPGAAPLFMLFASTAGSCLALRTPWSSYREAGLLHRRLGELGPAGVRIIEASELITQLTDQSRQAHLDLLAELLGVLLGERGDLVFTSADLLAAGVDDTPPDSRDYPWDFEND
ncbi:hypothetical protein [Amycolatopsis sp. DSM 110486]|uniref:hypothetical protein n=1 Tax=Amycolatopsis sp. DSM 110486 TaxID=2865832 RepID=UPI001C69C8B4|nr:hypothetical protein [Amycolatopsis sp. DSM 110486]QYN24970.1 hypothetical protein K1T34_22570 [Amycolatopsis sp. DSM 110486]